MSSSRTKNTAAEPISLACFDSGCNAVLILSTVASMALFNNSTITSKNTGISNNRNCSVDVLIKKASGKSSTARVNSCRNADSCCQARRMPSIEHWVALKRREIPVPLGLLCINKQPFRVDIVATAKSPDGCFCVLAPAVMQAPTMATQSHARCKLRHYLAANYFPVKPQPPVVTNSS